MLWNVTCTAANELFSCAMSNLSLVNLMDMMSFEELKIDSYVLISLITLYILYSIVGYIEHLT